jgi:hypothetical protein
MLDMSVRNNTVHIGPHFNVKFQRTLRIPDDGGTYPLPPSLGCFPIYRVKDYEKRVPEAWNEHGGVFIPMYQREALWLSFGGSDWCPSAVKVAVGKVNALTGKRLHKKLNRTRQNYLVTPNQPWLDGIHAGEGYIRQFVAMPLGGGYTVEEQITGKAEFGGMQIMVYAPKEGEFHESPESLDVCYEEGSVYSPVIAMESESVEMGLGAGGKMDQKIYPDEYGVGVWDTENFGEVYVHIVNSEMFQQITDQEPPATPISAETYTEYGYPWFRLYDEYMPDIEASEELAKVKSVNEVEQEKTGVPVGDDSVDLGAGQTVGIGLGD